MKIIRVLLNDLHWLELLKPRFLANLILTCIRVSGQVPHIGNISNISDVVTEIDEVTLHNIKSQERADIPKVHITIDRWATNVHADMGRFERSEQLFFAGQAVLNVQRGKLGHVDSLV